MNVSATQTADAGVESKVKQLVANIRNLPTPPIVFTQIQKVISKENASAGDVAKILSEDPSMSVKVLKLTNSAFYGLAREVESVKQAVTIVGFEAVKNLVLSASVLEMFKGSKVEPDFQERYWRHSLATAIACRMVAKSARAKVTFDSEAVFSAGLLHDIGKLVLACFLTPEHVTIQVAIAQSPDRQDADLEREKLGFTHADVGAALAAQWNLPTHLSDAIHDHQCPKRHLREDGSDDPAMSYVVNLANHIAKVGFADDYEGRIIQPVDPETLDFLGIARADVTIMVDNLHEEYTKAETFMSMAGS